MSVTETTSNLKVKRTVFKDQTNILSVSKDLKVKGENVPITMATKKSGTENISSNVNTIVLKSSKYVKETMPLKSRKTSLPSCNTKTTVGVQIQTRQILRKTRNNQKTKSIKNAVTVDEKLNSTCVINITRLSLRKQNNQEPLQKNISNDKNHVLQAVTPDKKLFSPCIVKVTRTPTHDHSRRDSKSFRSCNTENSSTPVKSLNSSAAEDTSTSQNAKQDKKLLSPCVVNVIRTPIHKRLRHAKRKHVNCNVNQSPTSSKPVTTKNRNKKPKNLLDALINEQTVAHRNHINAPESNMIKKTIINVQDSANVKNRQTKKVTKEVTEKKKKPSIKSAAVKRNVIKKSPNIVAAAGVTIKQNTKLVNEAGNKECGSNIRQRCLRTRKELDYKEVSLGKSGIFTTNNEIKSQHVPIYLQKAKKPSPVMSKEDVYAFVPDKNDANIKRKRKKRASDVEFVVKPARNRRRQKVKWQNRVKDTLTSLGLDYASKTLEKDIENLIKTKLEMTKADQSQQETAKDRPESGIKGTTTNQDHTTHSTQIKTINGDLNATNDNADCNANSASLFDENDPYFGFCDDETTYNKESAVVPNDSSKKIKIISNILLTPPNKDLEKRQSITNPSINSSLNISLQPKANSTMIDFAQSKTPWRTSVPVERNPHFLLVKKNSLPSVDQQMVLDATLEDSFTHLSVKKPVQVMPKEYKQQSILKYTKDTMHIDDSLNNNETSLFDADQYSPIKIQPPVGNSTVVNLPNTENSDKENTTHKIPSVEKIKRNIFDQEQPKEINLKDGKENDVGDIESPSSIFSASSGSKNILTPSKQGSTLKIISENLNSENGTLKRKHLRRNILGEKNDNIDNIQKNIKTPSKQEKPLKIHDVSDYFGFTSFDETSREISPPKKKRQQKLPEKKAKSDKVPVVLLVNIIKHMDEKDLLFIKEYEQYNKTNVSTNRDTNIINYSSDEDESKKDDDVKNEVCLFEDPEPKVSNRIVNFLLCILTCDLFYSFIRRLTFLNQKGGSELLHIHLMKYQFEKRSRNIRNKKKQSG